MASTYFQLIKNFENKDFSKKVNSDKKGLFDRRIAILVELLDKVYYKKLYFLLFSVKLTGK